MAVIGGHEPITSFEQWYDHYEAFGNRNGNLDFRGIKPCGEHLFRQYMDAKREMDARVHNYWKLEAIADGEVLSKKPDLPNVSSGETAGLIRRTARNLVQNAPNVEVVSKFNDDSAEGRFSEHILKAKIIGSDYYSNDMQQNLFASAKLALTLGFDAVIPVLLRSESKGWYVKYDSIHYRDIFPEPGVRDVRDAEHVFVRRYLTAGDVRMLIASNAPGWDIQALKLLSENDPPAREQQSTPHQDKKHRKQPNGYEVITWYSSTGDPFLTFDGRTKLLLRIEINKHPQRRHPVHFLVLEKDLQQPLGKSQVELLVGRQEFQDLMLNGAMKLWYRNINPSIIGYGTGNAIPNLSPGKYTQFSNPNAKLEAFEVNTGTLMQYGQISQQNMGSMVNLLGTADQAMASGQGGMGQTPQGVEAQASLVDITTNNYQKAIEGFFSHYCSYALTIYFAELRAVKSVEPTAEARMALFKRGFKETEFKEDGTLEIDFNNLAVEYFVRCVPGSLTELEDEKQLRVLNAMFVPLSQALPAMAAANDQRILSSAAVAMQYIMKKQIELSGADDAQNIVKLWDAGDVPAVEDSDARLAQLEGRINDPEAEAEREQMVATMAQMQQQMSLMGQALTEIMTKLGVQNAPSESQQPELSTPDSRPREQAPTVTPASA